MQCGWEGNWRKVMAAYRRVYGFGHLRAYCREQGRSQGMAKATSNPSKKNCKAKTTYAIYNIHTAH